MPYSAFPENPFKKGLLSRKRMVGCWSTFGNPVSTEIMGLAGFDWLLLDAEHALNDVLSLAPQLMALKSSPSAPVVRPPWNEMVVIKRLIDAGFYNFLIPFVQSEEEARKAVSYLRYPPEGVRGVAMSHRSNMYGTIPDYYKKINGNMALLVQIENIKGVEAAREIAAVDGVDAVFVGPSDLAASLGRLGDFRHPDVQRAIQRVADNVTAAGKTAAIVSAGEEDAKRYRDMGFTTIAVGSETGLLRSASLAMAEKYKSFLA
ncbi:MAG: 2-dehydro-3-deoxyglucarate aldolase [Planctomycetota bacterium]|nr:2-dehydro-3-deoxyglucarate aldolase [Planctomycetota bacterium]